MLVFQGSIHSNIQIIIGVNTHNNFEKIIFKEILQKISDIFKNISDISFAMPKFFYRNKIKIISRKFIIGSSWKSQLNWVHHDYIIQEGEVIFEKTHTVLWC